MKPFHRLDIMFFLACFESNKYKSSVLREHGISMEETKGSKAVQALMWIKEA